MFTVYLAAYFTNAMTPERSPDGTAYHLGLVARYLREHGFRRITTNMYANLSQGVEMLHLFAFAFGRHSAAALVHFCFLATLPLAMLCYARRFAFPAAGVAEAYTSRDILAAYQSACNEVTRDILWTPVLEYFRPQRQVVFGFGPRKLRAVRVVQTASEKPEHWSISEFDVLGGQQELKRTPSWKLEAYANPWDAEMAVDRNAATRWRSWEGLFFPACTSRPSSPC